jgi:hypothetical protein
LSATLNSATLNFGNIGVAQLDKKHPGDPF